MFTIKKKKLGINGLVVTELCFGTLPLGPLQTNMSLAKGAEVIKYALNNGVNFIDTAHVYRTYKYVKEAIKDIDREKYVIASKSKESKYDKVKKEVEEGLEKLGLEYFDIFHIHAAREANPFDVRSEALKALVDCKKEGLIKNIGIATHYVKVVKEASMVDEIDIVFPIINKVGMGIVDGSAEEMLEAIKSAKEKGKGIYAMKTLAGGRLINELYDAITFVRNNSFIDCIAVGMVDKKEVDINLSIFNDEVLEDKDFDLELKNYKKLRIMSHLCILCGNCIEECPNFALSAGENSAEVDHDKCILCGYCTRVCPELAIRIA